jgi:copper chaperone
METLKFKTNINCGGCIATVTPFLNKADGIETWKVDTENPQKILTVETSHLNSEEVIKIINEAGYKAEKIN